MIGELWSTLYKYVYQMKADLTFTGLLAEGIGATRWWETLFPAIFRPGKDCNLAG